MSIVRLALLVTLVAARLGRLASAQTAVDAIDVDGNGVGRAIVDWPREQRVEFGIWAVRNDWKQIAQQWSLADRVFSRDGASRLMRGRFDLGGKSIWLQQRTGPMTVHYDLTAVDAVPDLTGLFWFFGVPADAFAGGSVTIGNRTIALPLVAEPNVRLGEATGERAMFTSRDRTRRIDVAFAKPRTLRVQDARAYGSSLLQIYAPLIAGPLAIGQTADLDVTMAAKVATASRDANVTVDATRPVSDFDGFGGNFVYAIDDPTTDVALRELRPTWARIAIEGREWTGDDDAAGIEAADAPGTPLRRRFELAKRLNALVDGRLILSMWYPPERLFASPTERREVAGRIMRDRWPALADGIVAYLLRLKSAYGVEPRYFSFNESDLGVYLLLDGIETRDLTTLLGERFRDAKLTTKILLGDSSDVAKGLDQIAPTLADDAARSFVGALAYHPWSGQNEAWPRWAALSAKRGLPLFTTEMGSDPDGWRTGTFNAPLATLRLGRRYVEQLRDARSRALLEWEWTGDYAITEKSADGTLRLSPRGELLKQFTRHTPTFGTVVASTCDDPTLTVAAVARGSAIAVHLVNSDADRAIRLTGLPAATLTLYVVDARSGPLPASRVDAIGGACTILVPAGAIATLSNVE